ncbi:MAG: ATP-binding cassette domain-containing protein [Gammaproteobacteria bacterium]|nr:ATP-binding cassette domain-containing protein [Gammaproteobacteria bacterium]
MLEGDQKAGGPPGADIEFRGVSKRYGAVLAVDGVDLTVQHGAFHSLLGPSGCGKTTSLRMIAGFEQPSDGDVRIGGRSVVGTPPHRRPVNMVFQHYALFPHLSVAGNVGYGLRQRRPRPAAAEIEQGIGQALELVRLPGFERRRVWELSGGQQQRVALARALINRPTCLLLDEPLAALDRKLRREMQMELQSLQREVGITFVLVTHDQEEALSMSDHISVMREGRIAQSGTPGELYDAPASRYVADFVGETNFFAGEVVGVDAQGATVQLASGPALSAPYSRGAAPLSRAGRAVIALRPEVIELRPAAAGLGIDAGVSFAGRVHNRIYLGDQTEFRVTTEELGEVLVRAGKTSQAVAAGVGPGDPVVLGWRQDAGLALSDD